MKIPKKEVKEIHISPNSERQIEFLQSSEYEVLYGGAAGAGKKVWIEEKVPTPTGWTTMGELKRGDTIFTELGKQCKVILAHPIDDSPKSFKLIFDDGSEILADAEHLWLTYTAKELAALTRRDEVWRAKRRGKRASRVKGNKSDKFTKGIIARNKIQKPPTISAPTGAIRTTQEIVDTLYVGTRKNHAMPVAQAVELPEANLLIEPYLFGLWLGDGFSGDGVIGMMKKDWRPIAHNIKRLIASDYTELPDENIEIMIRRRFVNLRRDLRTLGVFKNKNIPQEYLRSSKQQRLELLRGLMDSDGTADKIGRVQFTNTNRKIIDGIHELITSLGWKARIVESRAMLYGKDYGAKWNIDWTPSEYVFHLPRKKKRQKLSSRRTTKFRYVVSCEQVNSVPMRCITVDNPTGLFLVGKDFLVTHNSWILCYDPLRYVAYSDFTGIIFRRTFPELEGSIMPHCQRLYPHAGGVYNVQSKTWTFPSGATIRLGFMQYKEDWGAYAGHEYAYEAFDELTTFQKDQWDMLRVWNRSKAMGIEPYRRASSNPGNVGHVWVKQMFVDPCKPIKDGEERWSDLANLWWQPMKSGKSFTYKDPDSGATLTRKFIPARVFDNVDLLERNPQYINNLLSLSPHRRKALLEGDWDIFEGQFFSGFRTDIHVIPSVHGKDFHRRFKVVGGLDYGQRTVLEMQYQDYDGRITNFAECYTKYETPEERAVAICELLKDWKMPKFKMNYDTNMKVNMKDYVSSTEAPIATFKRVFKQILGNNAPQLIEVSKKSPDNSRYRVACNETFKQLLHYEVNGEGKIIRAPKYQITEDCPNLIRTIPELIHDPDSLKGLDFDDSGEDDPFDGAKYGFMSWKLPKAPPKEPTKQDPYYEANRKRRARTTLQRISWKDPYRV